jgi:voltage-dependent anion channel protein 2
MGKGAVFYSEIGKKAKDLLTKDYTYDHKLVISTTTQSGLAFTSNAVNRGDTFLADISTSFRNKSITADVKVDTKSNVSINCFIGLTMSFRNLYSLFT